MGWVIWREFYEGWKRGREERRRWRGGNEHRFGFYYSFRVIGFGFVEGKDRIFEDLRTGTGAGKVDLGVRGLGRDDDVITDITLAMERPDPSSRH